MLLSIDFDNYFVNVEGITKVSLLPFHSSCVSRAEFDAPEADCFSG